MELSEFDKLAEKTVNKYIRESGILMAERAALAGEAKLQNSAGCSPSGATTTTATATGGGTVAETIRMIREPSPDQPYPAPSLVMEYPATPQEAFVKEGSRDMYFTYKGRIVECEIPKKWTEIGYGPVYQDGFEDGLEGSSGDEVASYGKRIEAEAYLEGFNEGFNVGEIARI